jgi:phage shock protein PspC (stress-responsive transcriptional regulator)
MWKVPTAIYALAVIILASGFVTGIVAYFIYKFSML